MDHPHYPIAGNGWDDRCVCGGQRRWHGEHGCDDCECTDFVAETRPTATQLFNMFLEFGIQAELDEWEDASAFVVEVVTLSGYRQLIGPFDKSSVAAFAAIERLRAEEGPGDNTRYRVALLFPVSSTEISKVPFGD